MSRYPDLSKYPVVAVDVETDGTDWHRRPYPHGPVFGIAVATPDHHAWYFDVRSDPGALVWAREEFPKLRSWCAHFAAFDYQMLLTAGAQLPDTRAICTMTDAALINEHLLHYDLDSLGLRYLDQRKEVSIYDELANLFGGAATKDTQMPNLHRAPVSLVSKYAKQDALLCMALHQWQCEEIERQAHAIKTVETLNRVVALERRVWPALRRMERRGVRVNVSAAEKALKSINLEHKRLQRELNREAGFVVNPNPSGSIHDLFKPEQISPRAFRLIDGTIAPATDGGKASINAEVLQVMRHPAARMILELRQLIRMRDVFISGHILGSHVNGRVHPTINQTKTIARSGTGTGRLSYTEPALQQIPSRNRRVASVVRALFIPDDGREWVCYDWKQFEFRMFAHYAKDESILAVYNRDPDADYHGTTAEITGLPRSPTSGQKGNAKQINLGLVFGMGPGKMAQEMGLDYEEMVRPDGSIWLKPGQDTLDILDKYHEAVPGIKRYLDRASAVAKKRGFVATGGGRHLRFPGGKATHKAGGLILQGTSADCMKLKVIEVDEYLRDRDAELLLSVHDELDVEMNPRDSETREGIRRIQEDFGPESALPLVVPIRVDVGCGPNWWLASKA